MDSFELWAVEKFAIQLGVARNTAKRLFERNVFDNEWLVKTPGGHWRLQMNGKRLETAEILLRRWQLFSRKPQAAKALPDPLASEDIALRVFSVRVLDESVSPQNRDDVQRLIFSTEGAALYSRLISTFKEEGKTKQGAALLEVLSAHLGLIEKWGRKFEVSISDIAEALHCSKRSLYRQPFGKECIERARSLLRGFTSCPVGAELVEDLAGKLCREPPHQRFAMPL